MVSASRENQGGANRAPSPGEGEGITNPSVGMITRSKNNVVLLKIITSIIKNKVMKPFPSCDSEAREWKKVKNLANEAYQLMGITRELEGVASQTMRIIYPEFPLQIRLSTQLHPGIAQLGPNLPFLAIKHQKSDWQFPLGCSRAGPRSYFLPQARAVPQVPPNRNHKSWKWGYFLAINNGHHYFPHY